MPPKDYQLPWGDEKPSTDDGGWELPDPELEPVPLQS